VLGETRQARRIDTALSLTSAMVLNYHDDVILLHDTTKLGRGGFPKAGGHVSKVEGDGG
jgi:hypothetical protein